jgi:hypothetical protein
MAQRESSSSLFVCIKEDDLGMCDDSFILRNQHDTPVMCCYDKYHSHGVGSDTVDKGETVLVFVHPTRRDGTRTNLNTNHFANKRVVDVVEWPT